MIDQTVLPSATLPTLAPELSGETPRAPERTADLGLIHGFALIRSVPVAELHGVVHEYRHLKTGAEIVLVLNQDTNRHFGIKFQTAAMHGKGIAHIGEHLVFRGSEKFPGTDPVNSYLQESLSSVSNAATSYDHTVYYCGSPHLLDFHNQRDQIVDAVFAARNSDAAFRQEAWRVERNGGGELSLNGIVLNEMRGYASNPKDVHNSVSMAALFPDTHYRFEFAGSPREIPNLTPEELREFMREHNHPSNCRVFLYGALRPDEELRALSERFNEFSRREVLPPPLHQAWFSEPARTEAYYPGAEAEDAGRDSLVSVTWRLGKPENLPRPVDLRVLEDLLLSDLPGTVGGALNAADLGEQVISEGLDESLKESTFAILVTGTAAARTGEIESAILAELRRYAEEGFPPDVVKQAVQRVRLKLLKGSEAANCGEHVMDETFIAWNHGQDPIARLQWKGDLARLEEQLERNPRYFESLIEKLFLENSHRVTLTVRPDRKLTETWNAEDRERAAQIGETALDESAAPSAPPVSHRLKISDLDSRGPTVERYLDREVWCYPIPGREIITAQLAMSFAHVPEELLPYVQAWSSSLGHLERSSNRGRVIEEFELDTYLVSSPNNTNIGRLNLSAEAFAGDAASLLETIAGQFLIDPLEHRRELIRLMTEQKAMLEGEIQEDPQLHCRFRSGAKFHPVDSVLDGFAGIAALDNLKLAISEAKHHWRDFSEKLSLARELVLKHGDPVWALIGDSAAVETAQPLAHELAQRFGTSPGTPALWTTAQHPLSEGFSAPSQVTASAVGFNLKSAGYEYHGSMEVLLKLIEHGRIWPIVRQNNGAYQPRVNFNTDTGALTIGAGFDNRPHETIEAAIGIPEWLNEIAPRIKELRRSKIGAIGEFDSPKSGPDRAEQDFRWRLRGLPLDRQERVREQIFETNAEYCRELASAIARARSTSVAVSVIGSRSQLQHLNRKRGEDFLRIRRLE